MKVSDITLAQYAGIDEEGRFTLVKAGFTRLVTHTLPFTVPSLYLFLKLMAGGADVGINRIHVRLAGPQGILLKAEGSLTVTDDGWEDSLIPMSFHFQKVMFESEGNFDFQVSINGRVEAKQAFHVTHTVRNSL